MEITLSKTLPSYPSFVEGIRQAPDRGYTLTPAQTATALKNALRYIPKELHETLAPEFMEELRTRGRIYGYRYRPQGDLKAKPIDEYKGNCIEGKAFQVMIDNNLCFDIALYPYELVTYGETGQVCQNWMQYRLIKQYLEVLTREQTWSHKAFYVRTPSQSLYHKSFPATHFSADCQNVWKEIPYCGYRPYKTTDTIRAAT